MLFQTVVLEGSETTRLSGVVRGYMNTPVQAHASGAAIWVFRNPGEGNTVQGLPIGTHNIKLRPVSGDEVLGADRVDRLSLAVTGKAMVPWARRRAAGGTHGGFRRRKLEPGGRCFRRGRDAHRERERAGARRILRGFRPYGGGYGACGQRHVHHPYALGTLRAVRDGAAARVCFPGGIRHRGIAGRGIRGLSRAFQRIRTQRHVSRGRSSGPSGPAAIWGSGPAKQARRRRNGEFDPDRA